MRSGVARALAGIGLLAALTGGQGACPAWAADPATSDISVPRAEVVDLGMLPGAASSEAVDVNDEGTVIGRSAARAVRWDPSGRITDLGALPGGLYSQAVDINNEGVTVGQSTSPDGRYHLVLWDRDGRITDVGTLPGGTYFDPMAIIDDGTVFGHGDAGDGRPHPARWRPDTGFVELSLLPAAYHGGIAAVNERGLAIGYIYGPNLYGHLVRWDRAGRPTDLGTPGHLWSSAVDINDSAVVVGTTWPGIGPEFTPVRWARNGRLTELRTPYTNGRPRAVNDDGVVVGSWFGPHGEVPARWGRDGSMLTLRMMFDYWLGRAEAVNEQGTTIGYVDLQRDEQFMRRAVRWDPDGSITDLGTLGGERTWPTALNEAGTTVGNAMTMDGETHAVLWPAGPSPT